MLCGTASTHCCWFEGVQCKFLEVSEVPGFNWSCSLRRELGDWKLVHEDPRYISEVKPRWDKLPYVNLNCGDWPPKGMTCNECGNCG